MEHPIWINTLHITRCLPLTGWNTRNNIEHFIGDLTELLTEVVSNHSNLIILGDINLHLNKLEDTDGKVLCDILEAFNITQHIKFPTHNLGHTIDVIATGNIQNRNFTMPGPYSSDHQVIAVQLEDKNHETQQMK